MKFFLQNAGLELIYHLKLSDWEDLKFYHYYLYFPEENILQNKYRS